MAKNFERLRPKPYIIFVGEIWNGCKMYQVCGNDKVDTSYHHTKKEAATHIRQNYAGDEKRIRLHDLHHCARMHSHGKV